MNGCEDRLYAVTVLVANVYQVTAASEEEATSKATKAWLDGEKAPAVWPVSCEVTALEPVETVKQ